MAEHAALCAGTAPGVAGREGSPGCQSLPVKPSSAPPTEPTSLSSCHQRLSAPVGRTTPATRSP